MVTCRWRENYHRRELLTFEVRLSILLVAAIHCTIEIGTEAKCRLGKRRDMEMGMTVELMHEVTNSVAGNFDSSMQTSAW